jgi:heme/copper-type cytochrome/quinol oxidase subunit 2
MRRLVSAALPLLVAFLAGCGSDSPSILEPDSNAGRRIAGLWWVLFWISVVAVAVVVGFLVVAVRRRRREPPGEGDAGGRCPGATGSWSCRASS